MLPAINKFTTPAVILVFLLSGCSTKTANIKKGIAADEGYMLINYSCPESVKWFHFLKAGKKPSTLTDYFPDKQFLCSTSFGTNRDGVKLVKMKAGNYFLSAIGYTSILRIEESKAYKVNVAPGKITYIGKLHITHVKTLGNIIYIKHEFTDNYENDRNDILKVIPEGFNDYELELDIATKSAIHGETKY